MLARCLFLKSLLWTLPSLCLCSCTGGNRPDHSAEHLEEILSIGVPSTHGGPRQTPLNLQVHGKGLAARICLQAQEVSIAEVVEAVLTRSGVSYRIGNLRLNGRCSLALEDRPLLEALGLILRSCEAEAKWIEEGSLSLVSIENRSLPNPLASPPSASPSPSKAPAVRAISFAHRDVKGIGLNLLGSSQSEGGIWKGSGSVQFALHPDENRIYCRGNEEEVGRALQICRAADQPGCRVHLEVAFFSRRPFRDTLQQKPRWTLPIRNSYVQWAPQQVTLQNGIEAAFNSAHLPASFDWESLHIFNSGKFVGHAELLVQSGSPVSLKVGKTGYILLTTLSSGVPSAQQEKVDASLATTITPHVLPGGLIQLNFDFSTARFEQLQSSGIRAGTKNRQQTSTVTIPAGGFVIMGGSWLAIDEENQLSAPWLRHLPIVGDLFTQFSSKQSHAYVVQYIRAYVEDPDAFSTQALDAPSSIPVTDWNALETSAL